MSNQLTTIIEDYQRGVSIRDLAAWYGVDRRWLRWAVTAGPDDRYEPAGAPQPQEPPASLPPKPRPHPRPIDQSRVARYIRRRREMPVHYGNAKAQVKKLWQASIAGVITRSEAQEALGVKRVKAVWKKLASYGLKPPELVNSRSAQKRRGRQVSEAAE